MKSIKLNSVSDLKGSFVTTGADAPAGQGAGIDIFGGNGSQGQTVRGASFGYTVLGADYTPPLLPGEVHGGVTTTWVASVNVPDLWRRLRNSGPRVAGS